MGSEKDYGGTEDRQSTYDRWRKQKGWTFSKCGKYILKASIYRKNLSNIELQGNISCSSFFAIMEKMRHAKGRLVNTKSPLSFK